MRIALRALVLAALLSVVPVSVASAGVQDDEPKYPPPTHTVPKTQPPQTRPPTIDTLREQGRGGLAQTGSDSTPLVWGGVAALSVGAVLVIGARRRASVRR